MTLSSQYKFKMKKKIDPLVSVKGHFNPKFTTLSSQYKVNMKKKRPSRLSTRSLQSKIYDLLVSVQGQNEKKNYPLVSVQGLGLYLYIYFIVFYFHNRTKLVFLSLLIFYSDNLNFISSNHLVKFK